MNFYIISRKRRFNREKKHSEFTKIDFFGLARLLLLRYNVSVNYNLLGGGGGGGGGQKHNNRWLFFILVEDRVEENRQIDYYDATEPALAVFR